MARATNSQVDNRTDRQLIQAAADGESHAFATYSPGATTIARSVGSSASLLGACSSMFGSRSRGTGSVETPKSSV